MSDASDQLAVYRDTFAEITAKATPLEHDPNDAGRITAYRVPVGPIHRAAGRLGFQMFDGELHLQNAVADIAKLKAALLSVATSTDTHWAQAHALSVLKEFK